MSEIRAPVGPWEGFPWVAWAGASGVAVSSGRVTPCA